MTAFLFDAGDVISFVCRDGSFGMAKVLKVETSGDLPVPQPVYHLLIYTLKNLFPPNAAYIDGAKPFIGHLPVLQAGIEKSGCVKIGTEAVGEREMEGYAVWREAFYAGDAGIFDLTIDEAVAIVLEALGKGGAAR